MTYETDKQAKKVDEDPEPFAESIESCRFSALVLLPEPVTTPIGMAVLGLSFAVPPERRRALVHCGASIRRGHLGNYGHGYA